MFNLNHDNNNNCVRIKLATNIATLLLTTACVEACPTLIDPPFT